MSMYTHICMYMQTCIYANPYAHHIHIRIHNILYTLVCFLIYSSRLENICVKLCIIEHCLFYIKNVKSSHFHDAIEREEFDSHSNCFVV